MFSFSETVPPQYPAETVLTQNTVGPVVCGFSRKLDAMIALDATELWEAIVAGLPMLEEARQQELVALCGGTSQEDTRQLIARAETAEALAADATGDMELLAEQIAAKVATHLPQPSAPEPVGITQPRRGRKAA